MEWTPVVGRCGTTGTASWLSWLMIIITINKRNSIECGRSTGFVGIYPDPRRWPAGGFSASSVSVQNAVTGRSAQFPEKNPFRPETHHAYPVARRAALRGPGTGPEPEQSRQPC